MPRKTPRARPNLPASLLRSRPGGLPTVGKWISTSEAAQRLAVTARTVRHWIGRHLRGELLGGRMLVAACDVDYLERRAGLEPRDRSAELVAGLVDGSDAAELVARSGASIDELERAAEWVARVRGRIVLELEHLEALAALLPRRPTSAGELVALVEELRAALLRLAVEAGARNLTAGQDSRS